MKRYLICLLSLLLLSGVSTATFAKGKKSKKKAQTTTAAAPAKKQSEYDKLFKDKQVKTSKGGIMTLHIVDDKLFVELPLKMLNRDMMLMSSVAEITDHTDSYVGLSPLRPLQVKFDTINRTVLLRRDRSQSVVADNGEEIRRALAQSNMPAILGSYKIKAFNADSTAVVFDMTDLFIGNESLLTAIDPRSETKLVLRGVSFNQKKDRSMLTDVAAFDDNATVTSYITYDSKIGKTYNKVTTAKLVRSLALLPETPMRPRLADFRLPLNVLGKYNYHSDYKLMDPVYFATRWRMEPSDQAAYDRGEAVEPKAPVVFYIDTTFTAQMSAAITKGILEWNKCFEAIGFKNAIRVRPFPTPDEDPQFSPQNFRYNCINYVPSLTGDTRVRTYVDPRSGEILRTTVMVCHNMTWEMPFEIFVFTAHADPSVRQRYMPDSTLFEHIKNHFTWLTGVDCFGMSYNLTSSAAFSSDSLRHNAAFTQKYGTTPSMLDIAKYNFIAPIDAVKKGFRITPVGVGEYDYHVVKCLYKPVPEAKTSEEELKVIEKWVDATVGNPVYRYENAKDCPDCGANDVGDDDIKNFKYALGNLQYCMENFDKWISDEDDPEYLYRNGIYNYLYRRYKQLLTQVAITAYGVKTYERKANDPVPSYEFTPYAEQKEALDILYANRYMPDWVQRPELVRLMGIQRERIEEHKDYLSLLMNATATRLFIYEGQGKEHFDHKRYIRYMFDKLFEKTRKGQKLSDEDFYYQTNFAKTMMLSSKIVDRKAKYRDGSASALAAQIAGDPKVLDFSDPETCMKTVEEMPLLYSMNDVDFGRDEVSAQYGALKKWPVINTQSTRQLYYGILKELRQVVMPYINSSDRRTREHYRFIYESINRLID
ncbi:DUF5117 and DUF5118 domain-containing protein [Alistipes timonensis]|mgnify:FL=1|uniref:DUF5117 and DUF5118 domain-containing protein n=1 Tax=Alistipes timonensis TaxID=1465754 RepID=UPI001C3DB574|nr:zinc-dependent metalloprotease [Alistipes timonensis]MCR2030835.1 zinc-dependent metalloprotease [Alistipes timonensis]